VRTQSVINRKHLSFAAARGTLGIMAKHLMHGQTNFTRMLWRFNKVYNANRQLGDHEREIRYSLPLPDHHAVTRKELFVHHRASSH